MQIIKNGQILNRRRKMEEFVRKGFLDFGSFQTFFKKNLSYLSIFIFSFLSTPPIEKGHGTPPVLVSQNLMSFRVEAR